ncbi:hypothetical protein QBC32DRAFT_224138 [Pseudoneurospora amorphoporcata]|uniref:Uncharacterized protein n=1 Tax=Pseudoneurospora amorphoporcata TaxID=241081 RepID=A0AAN6NM88_9PEZI|nr:hypothetical protein QBC32DRAFT_224138 [Pseudoneurospora amorphoporcata]
MQDLWFDIVEEGQRAEEPNEPRFFGPPRPPAQFHWEVGHDDVSVLPIGPPPIDEVFHVDDLLWDGAYMILPRGPVPEPRDVDDQDGPFWAPPPATPRQHHFLPIEHWTGDEDEHFLQSLKGGTAENTPLDPLNNLLLDRPPWADDFPPPPRATAQDIIDLVEREPPIPPPGWQTALTLIRPWFHEAPWRLEPATNIPEHIVGEDDLRTWVEDAVDVLIRRNRTLLQLIRFDVIQAISGPMDDPRA